MTEGQWYFAAYCYMGIDAVALFLVALSFAIIRAEDPNYRSFFWGALITIAGAAYAVHAFWLIGDWYPGSAFPWPRLVGDVALAIISVRRAAVAVKLKARITARIAAALEHSHDKADQRAPQVVRRR